ncbi:MAG: NADH-quinone oxidoreductase subunit K [Pseudomonadota bacterium]
MTGLIYAGLGVFLFVFGLLAAFQHRDTMVRLVALNIAGAGIFLFLVGSAGRDGDPEPVSHALVITGIVVAVSLTGVALGLLARLVEAGGHDGEGL